MYASIFNQLYELAHYFFSFCLLMVVWPRYFLNASSKQDKAERRLGRYMRAVFWYIVIGYALVVLKLFEVIAIVAVLLLFMFRDYLRRQAGDARVNLVHRIGLLFYELLEGGFRFKQAVLNSRSRFKAKVRNMWNDPESRKLLMPRVLLVVVLLMAGFLRFYDAVTSPTPALSDGYVTLAWMKYLEGRELFHDGIYPQGFHLTLAYLHKFAAIDQLYVLKYTGPWNGVLITFGLYFAVSRWTSNRYAGIVAAAVYGLAGPALHGMDWERQTATNSQEFAMVFIFPAFYFLSRYLQRGEREDLWTGAAGVAVTGLVHSLVFGYVGMGLGLIMTAGVLLGLRQFGKRVWHLTLVGVSTVVIAVIPLGVGYLIGRSVHSSSGDFLTSKVTMEMPVLHVWDYAGLAGLSLGLLAFLFRRKPFREKVMEASALLIIGATFVMYEFGGVVTQSLVLATRSGSLWAMAMPVAIGFGLYALWLPLQRIRGSRFIEAAICAVLIGGIVLQTGLQPIDPYKMEWDSGVDQYLQISETHRPKTWMIVSAHTEGYSWVLGNGYHMYLQDFIKQYDPSLYGISKYGWTAPDPNLPDDIYIYLEKNVFEVSKSNAIYVLLEPKYQERKETNAEFQKWIETYQLFHDNLTIFYEDDNLRVYHLQQLELPEDKQKEIWGESS